MKNKQVNKIIIRTPNWLGDLMMSTAFIKAVLRVHPEAAVDLIVRKGFERLPLPHRGEILPFDKSTLNAHAFGKQLRSRTYDRVYVLPPSISSALMAFSARIPDRIGYRGNLRGLFLNGGKSYRQKPRSTHLVTEYLQLIDSLPVDEAVFPELTVDDEWMMSELKDVGVSLPESFVTLSPGAIYGPAKQWPIGYYRRLAGMLAQSAYGVVVLGTDDDRAAGAEITRDLPDAMNLCGQTTLNQLVAILAASRLLVSNDSGTMHVMAALQKPQVAIFGSTSPVWTGPLNQQAAVVRKPMDCSPCFSRECRFDHYECLTTIQPDEVFNRIQALLS